jgi:hypothetical protein
MAWQWRHFLLSPNTIQERPRIVYATSRLTWTRSRKFERWCKSSCCVKAKSRKRGPAGTKCGPEEFIWSQTGTSERLALYIRSWTCVAVQTITALNCLTSSDVVAWIPSREYYVLILHRHISSR